jgi:anti-sigma factor RsiW
VKTLRFTPPYGDEAIVAWLDGAMDYADAQQFAHLLRSDAQLAGRTAELMQSNQDYQQAFAPLLREAPEARMKARLEAFLDAGQVAPRAGVSRRSLIAASLTFLLLGTGVGYLLPSPEAEAEGSDHLRELEAQYMSLYTSETLSDVDSSAEVLHRGLARVARDVGLEMQLSQLMLHNAELKQIRILRYDQMTIAQIAWLHADYGPVALCISPLANGKSTPVAREQRHSMNLAWWQSDNHQFVLIGRTPEAELGDSARQLRQRL